MSLTAYPTLRLKLTMPQALKLQFLPAVPGFNATAAVAEVQSKINRFGDTMTGFLTLNADPTALLHAATKQYVDDRDTPLGAEYVVSAADAKLTAERVLTDTTSITWDRTTAGQIKANTTAGGGNVSNIGTPTNGQLAQWTLATTIQGINQVTMAHLPSIATDSLLGRDTTGTGAVESIALGASLSMNGSGVLQRAALTGDVTAVANNNATTIAADAVTYTKMQNVSAASRLLGRGSASGSGDPEEITLGPNLTMAGTTLSVTGVSSFSTGDVKLTFKTVADASWILLDDGSIGDLTSAATTRANADTVDLFSLFWTNIPALVIQDSTGVTVSRGASAAADFAVHRRLVIPKTLGRSIAVAGAGSGLTTRGLGSTVGAETETPTIPKMASHNHGGGQTWLFQAGANANMNFTGGNSVSGSGIGSEGGSLPLNILDPTTYMNVMVKL